MLVQERSRKKRKKGGAAWGEGSIIPRMPRLIQRAAIKIRLSNHQSSTTFEKHISDLVLHLALLAVRGPRIPAPYSSIPRQLHRLLRVADCRYGMDYSYG